MQASAAEMSSRIRASNSLGSDTKTPGLSLVLFKLRAWLLWCTDEVSVEAIAVRAWMLWEAHEALLRRSEVQEAQ